MFNSWILDTPYKELILGSGRGMRSWQRPEISGFNMNRGAVCLCEFWRDSGDILYS